MQEIAEQQDVAQEISEAFSQRVGFDDNFDEVGDPIIKNGVWWPLKKTASHHMEQAGFLTHFFKYH